MTPAGRASRCVGVAAAGVLLAAGAASAGSTPVGPLPPGPSTTITAKRGALVAIALPVRPAASGLTWRLARRVDGHVLRQEAEGAVGASIVVVFRAVGPGTTRVAFALTRGDDSSRAAAALRFHVVVAG